MNNSDAYDFFTEHKHESIRFLSQSFIFQHGLEEDQLDNYRKKFSNMLTDREKYRKDQALKPRFKKSVSWLISFINKRTLATFS